MLLLEEEDVLLDELLEVDDELLLEVLLEELEVLLEELEVLLLEDEVLDELPEPVQVVVGRVPLCVAWRPIWPTPVLWPGCRLPFQLQQLLTVSVEVPPPDTTTFQLLVTFAGWPRPIVTVQPLMAVVPLLVTVRSIW